MANLFLAVDLTTPSPNRALQAIIDNLSIDSGAAHELVDLLDSDVIASVDVPSKTSGPQVVDYAAIDVPSSIEVPNNNSVPQDGNNDGGLKTAAFFAVADCVTSITAIVSDPPSSGHPVYDMAVVTACTVSVLATIWVSGEARNRRIVKRMIVCTTIATFILGLVLDVHACKVKNKK